MKTHKDQVTLEEALKKYTDDRDLFYYIGTPLTTMGIVTVNPDGAVYRYSFIALSNCDNCTHNKGEENSQHDIHEYCSQGHCILCKMKFDYNCKDFERECWHVTISVKVLSVDGYNNERYIAWDKKLKY